MTRAALRRMRRRLEIAEPADRRFRRVIGRLARGAALNAGDQTFYNVYRQTTSGRLALAGGAQ